MVRVERHELGPRVFLLGRRMHHGELGVLLGFAAAGLVVHDWPDRSRWFRVRP